MKLVKQTGETWQYSLNPVEVDLLKSLVKNFPFTDSVPVKISKSDTNPQTIEREKLLNESLAEHRKELKNLALNLVAANKLEQHAKRYLLKLNAEDREIMLQILNDIRVGCWRALGEPETLELQNSNLSEPELMRHHLMNLAGYFEHHLISIK